MKPSSGPLSHAGIAFFEDTLAATISLAFFLPRLIDSGGNAGSQAATLMVRALSTGDVKMGDWVRLVGKEDSVVALTMSIVVVVGSTIGMSLPFLLTRFGLDPATASAPLIPSLSDIAGVLIFFSIASWYLGL
jgi:magnesium transporter